MLDRFLNRLARHPIIRKDEILRSFLENPAEVRLRLYVVCVSAVCPAPKGQGDISHERCWVHAPC